VAFIGLWVASLLAIAVAYSGTMIGSIFLPPRIPAIPDLMLPLLLGMSEFVLFAVFASRAIGVDLPPNMALAIWCFALGAFGFVAAGSVWRAHQLVIGGAFAASLDPVITLYCWRLLGDACSAAVVGLAGLTLGCVCAVWGPLPTVVADGSATVLAAGLAIGLGRHQRTSRSLRDRLSVV
jgi:hypothetical protein